MRDTRDVNLDGRIDQKMLSMSLAAVGFVSKDMVAQLKTASTDIDASRTKDSYGPAAAPEGTDYTYYSSLMNLSNGIEQARNTTRPVLYDVLPYVGDTETSNTSNGEPVARASQWNGWISDLDSIKIEMYDPFGLHNPKLGLPQNIHDALSF